MKINELTNKKVFQCVAKLIRENMQIIKTIDKKRPSTQMRKLPHLSKPHKEAHISLWQKYMKNDFSTVIFTDERRIIFD